MKVVSDTSPLCHAVWIGEAEVLPRLFGSIAILNLARQLGADLVLVDERPARLVAEALRLPVMGLLGVLDEAARRGWLDFSSALDHLLETDFYLSPKLVEAFRKLHER